MSPASPPRDPSGGGGPAWTPGPGEALQLTIRSVFGSSRKRLGKIGITIPQGWLLSVVAFHGPLTPSELARRSQVSRQAMASALNTLERRRLIRRTRSQSDRRSLQIAITPEAQALFARMIPRIHEMHERIDGLFNEREQRALVPYLVRIAREFGVDDELRTVRCPLCAEARRRPRSAS